MMAFAARLLVWRMDMVKPLIGALLLCLTADVAAPQEYRGTILGRVFDQQGAVLPGATVQVVNDKTNITDQTVTEADGAYSDPFLIPGAYTIKVELQGFKRFVQSGVTVAIGQRATVDVRLELGDIVETDCWSRATRRCSRPRAARSARSSTKTRVEAMPLNGRMILLHAQPAGRRRELANPDVWRHRHVGPASVRQRRRLGLVDERRTPDHQRVSARWRAQQHEGAIQLRAPGRCR